MSEFSRRILVVALASLVLGLTGTLMSFTAYSVARSTQSGPLTASTSISLGQKFNWKVGEVVDVQGNLYAYQGFESPSYSANVGFLYSVRLARWQNAWLELSYAFYTQYPKQNTTLTPYILEIQEFNNNYLTARFFES